ncbi:RNA-directed DNA polymerase [Gregarina niphandrodes]|uniref:RNA-directed DNA polymerase n=1 Tax=Gregarina niphandrodes TaxID=110365 RepID=A0A023AX58_GRENI|nr:RNA-directed DNA polymerase [Gregarina niphandrodes]EZG42810.1 RNA-directed DNA polymerase [Gregarina niphandrodes]|eukprot:XP_011133910.1 RNA-directed DNA polymerase [Gregarina niphandrodes]
MAPDEKTYCCARMPMGAKTAPKHFAKVMSIVLGRLETDDQVNVRSYQDDIVVAANSRGELNARYDRVINLLRQQGFKVNPEKSSRAEVLDVLGYRISKDKIAIPIEKGKQIREHLRSENTNEVIRATHQLGYYKMILTPAQRDSAIKLRQILTKVGHFTQVARDLRQALDVCWEKPRGTPWQAKRLEIFVDASDTAAGIHVRYNGNCVLEEAVPLTHTVTNLASFKEIQGAYKLLVKYRSLIRHIDDGCEKIILTDNLRLYQGLIRREEPRNDLEIYASRIKQLYKAKFAYVPGGQNPADFISRRHRLPS